ncbi:MAG: OmpA family protein [Dehalococcoidia bacterium]|nr:OmpA family protein [Dehalococcoidia bacterium]MCB9595918.1 OmpA family protein [Sandaracinaceae bacterium]
MASAQDDEFEDFDDLEDEAEAGNTGGGSTGGGSTRASSDDEFDDLEDDADDDGDDGDLAGGDFDDDEDPADADDDDDDDEDASEVEAAQAFRERRHVLHNTINGSVGGFHIVDPGSGASAAFRAQLGIEFFFVDGWLTLPDAAPDASTSHSHVGGTLSLSWNPFDFLEFYASIASYANSNEQEDPALFQVLGDTLLGIKAWYRFEDAPILAIGGDLSVGLLNTVGDIGLVGDSTSVGLRANVGLDLRELRDPVPFIARLNLQYWFDNSSALVQAVERARYNALPPSDRRPCPEDMADGNCEEDRHLVTRVERYSLQIDRVDHFRIGLGVEAPITVMQDFTISPIAEWNLDIPVNRQGYSCLDTSVGGVVPTGDDACLRGRNATGGEFDRADAFEQTLTLGVRVLPPLRGLNLFVAVDIGLTGTNTFVRELSGEEPYNVRMGFGFAFDTVPQIEEVEREVIREVAREPEGPPTGRIIGLVVEQGTDTPVPGAIITFTGTDLTAQASDSGGRFTSYQLEAGEHQMAIQHDEYHPGTCAGTIAVGGGDVEVRCELTALPRVGSIRGSVRSETGDAVGGATVNLSGPANRSIITTPDGFFSTRDLQPGTYTARIESENYLIRVESFEVRAREEATPQITLIARPRLSLVRVSGRQIVIRRQVNFATDSSEILADSNALLTEIADVIMRHPEVAVIEIQGHTDNRGGRQHNQDLSQRRAEAVRDWLVSHGIESSRLEARGYGQDTPLVPNITAANRARNRRVQFMIRETNAGN